MFAILKFFAIVFLILYVLSVVSRFLIRRFFKRMASRYNGQQQGSTRPEGDVFVSKSPNFEKKVDKNIGDYVDYEEVK